MLQLDAPGSPWSEHVILQQHGGAMIPASMVPPTTWFRALDRIIFWLYVVGACLPWLASVSWLAMVGRVVVLFNHWVPPNPELHIMLREVLFHDHYYPMLFRNAEQIVNLAVMIL